MKKESTMIILSDDIIFRKAVIHLLNVELGKFAPAQDLFMMQPDVIELVRKQVCYLLNSDELKAADWNTKEPVFQKLEQMNEKDDKFTVEKEETIKDLGYIKLQTNNEIEIKIPMEEYQTKECIKVEEEPDGTKIIVMKNIEQVTVE